MIALVWLALAASPPAVVIVTQRGETIVPVTMERGWGAVAAPLLAAPLELSVALDGPRATVGLPGAVFVFQLGAPFVRTGVVVCGLVGEPYLARDTLFLPLSWLADCLPRTLAARYRWNAATTRLEELPVASAMAMTRPAPATPTPTPTPTPRGPAGRPAGAPPPPAGAVVGPLSTPNPITGLRQRHLVVIDPGHGGADPGNPGRYFPDGLVEKDITLAIGRLLRAELTRRGIGAAMTRATDTLVDLADRGAFCAAECDLFVSIHVNSMPAGRRADRVGGVETYFLSDAKTEDQERVAKMENEAIRFEAGSSRAATGPVGFILRDLQQNEYLRESAELAKLVQDSLARAHPGGDHGVQQASFRVLTSARRPAILVETGFATNRTDAGFLASSLGQHKIASAIADGLVAYLLEFERRLATAPPTGGR